MAGTTESGGTRPSSESGGAKKRQAGRYVLGDLLGRGGMAEVFSGHAIGDHGFQKPVAIKRLLPELANDKVFVDRLIQEAKLLVGMQHGNIVSVLDLARDGDDVFLVMEFVDGPSLRQLLKSRGTRGVSLGCASYIVQAAAAGLEFAHGRRGGAIIHADISPSNLLLTTSGEVRVADFGIARREGGACGIVEGKWAYMAPEQARGEPLTPRSDVFALGVVLYELITGAHPFGRQIGADERDGEQMRVIPPRIVTPSIPHGLDQICMKALAHDPDDRYARMQQLIDAILDERFANQWREGASDLATAIRECAPTVPGSGGFAAPRTMITERPVTIITRSLIELTPARRSSKRISQPQLAEHTPAPASAAEASVPDAAEYVAPAPAQMFELPPALRIDGPALPQFRLSDANVGGQDLASVHGGTAHSVDVPGFAAVAPRSNTWTIAVLVAAAVLGVVAAVAIQLGPETEVQASAQPVAVVASARMEPRRNELAEAVAKVAPSMTDVVALTSPPPTRPTPIDVPTTPQPEPSTVEPSTATPPSPPDAPGAPVRPRATREARKAAVKPAAVAKKDLGTLRSSVASETPWAFISVDNGRHLDAQGASFTLPPGKHTVRFYNDEIGASKRGTVVIEPGKVKRIKVNLDELTIVEIP